MTPARVLALRALGLGDLLAGVPALRGLRRALPGAEVVLAAPRGLAPLVWLSGTADEVLDHRGLAPIAWDGPPPDVAVDLHGRGPQSHRLLQSLGPGQLVAFDCPAAGHHGPQWREDEHERARWCRLVVESFRVAAGPDDVLLERPGQAPPVRAATVLHPGAASASRQWPLQRYAGLARRLAARGHRVVLTGGDDEVALCRHLADLAGLPEASVLAGRTDLMDLAALVACAELVVSGDTGMAHLAWAYRRPSVTLCGPTPRSRWGPPSQGPHVALRHGHGVGDPHGCDVDPALLRLELEEVLAAVDEVLDPVTRPAPVTAVTRFTRGTSRSRTTATSS